MDCSLVMLAGPDEAAIIRMMFNHAARMSGHAFKFRALTLDTMPSPRFPAGSESTRRLVETAEAMRASGEIDAIFRTTDPSADIERKHFGHRLLRKRDFRGIPLLGWAIGIERAPTDYVCHFDSDILMHTSDGYSWIDDGIDQLRSKPDVLFVAPKGGPGGTAAPRMQKEFSSRRFVVDRRRLESLLPLPPTHSSWKRRMLMRAGGPSSYWNWEMHMRGAIKESRFTCLYLGDPRAWAIHCPDHGALWKANLAQLVEHCEQGRFPDQQAGNGELDLAAWLNRATSF